MRTRNSMQPSSRSKPLRSCASRSACPRSRTCSPRSARGTRSVVGRLFPCGSARNGAAGGQNQGIKTMGLFKFIKEAGAKLMGGSAKAATPDDLKKTVEGHGFDAGKLNIDVQGDQVKLSGQAMTQEEAEKIILSLGNTIGIAQV